MIFQLFEKSCSVEQQNWDRLARKKVFKLNLLKHLMIRQFFINFILLIRVNVHDNMASNNSMHSFSEILIVT